jgi:hypothetical protein
MCCLKQDENFRGAETCRNIELNTQFNGGLHLFLLSNELTVCDLALSPVRTHEYPSAPAEKDHEKVVTPAGVAHTMR